MGRTSGTQDEKNEDTMNTKRLSWPSVEMGRTSGTQDEKNEDTMNTKRLSWRTKADQFFQSTGCGQTHVIKFMGICESCGRSVYSHVCEGTRPCGDVVTGSPDPRGIIPPQHCMNIYHANECDMTGRDVMSCYDCAQDGDRYRALVAWVKHEGTWKVATI